MNLYKILFFLFFIDTIFCCESWFRQKYNLKRQHILKNKLHKNKGKKNFVNLFKTPKHRNIRRKEKNFVKKNFGMNTKTWSSKKNIKISYNKHPKKPILFEKIKNKKKVNGFEVWNNKMTKALKVGTESFIKSVIHLPKLINKSVRNKTWKIETDNKIKKNIVKLGKGVNVWPEVVIDMSKHIDNTVNTPKLNCIEDSDCTTNKECGDNGSCYDGKCRCMCTEFSSCVSNSDCPGSKSKCVSKCIGKNGTSIDCEISYNKTLNYDNKEGYCSRGSQCLSGICIGGGRKRILKGIKFYEAISCFTIPQDLSCNGIGIEKCTTESDLIFRHTDPSLIGTKENIIKADIYHMKLNINFPACYGLNNNFVKCGEDIEDSCIKGAYCGYCKC